MRELLSTPSTRRISVIQTVVAGAIFLGFAIFLSWPTATDLEGTFYGGNGDPVGAIAVYRELSEGHHNPFAPGRLSDFNAPSGLEIPWSRNIASFPAVLLMYLLAITFNSVAALGIYTLAGYVFSGVTMFVLARRVTGNVWSALLAGWAFAFFPFAVLNGAGHVDFVWGGVLVLGVWRMLELHSTPTLRNGVLAGAAVAFGMWWSPYFILLGGVTYGALLVRILALSARRGRLREQIRPQLLAGGIVVTFLAALLVLSTSADTGQGLRTHSVDALNVYSARLHEYVIPDVFSPVFGELTTDYLMEHLHGSNLTESTLYVGISVILLALLGFVAAMRREDLRRLRAPALLLALAALVALVTSAPPKGEILGVTIPFPSNFIMKITTTWRVYSRFVIVVMLGLAVLAAIGLHVLTRGRPIRAQALIFAVIAAVVVTDLWARQPFPRASKITETTIYRHLKPLAPGILAEYPLLPSGYGLYDDLFNQQWHGHPILNGYEEGTVEETRALQLTKLSDPRTATGLQALGVRYVLMRKLVSNYGFPPPGKPTSQYRLIAEDNTAALYRVLPGTRPAGLAVLDEGFGKPENDADGEFAWLGSRTGDILVSAQCRRCTGTLSMKLSSFARPRIVTLRDAQGGLIFRRRIIAEKAVRARIALDRSTVLRLTTRPGPEVISATAGGKDHRAVSVAVRSLGFVPDARRR